MAFGSDATGVAGGRAGRWNKGHFTVFENSNRNKMKLFSNYIY